MIPPHTPFASYCASIGCYVDCYLGQIFAAVPMLKGCFHRNKEETIGT